MSKNRGKTIEEIFIGKEDELYEDELYKDLKDIVKNPENYDVKKVREAIRAIKDKQSSGVNYNDLMEAISKIQRETPDKKNSKVSEQSNIQKFFMWLLAFYILFASIMLVGALATSFMPVKDVLIDYCIAAAVAIPIFVHFFKKQRVNRDTRIGNKSEEAKVPFSLFQGVDKSAFVVSADYKPTSSEHDNNLAPKTEEGQAPK